MTKTKFPVLILPFSVAVLSGCFLAEVLPWRLAASTSSGASLSSNEPACPKPDRHCSDFDPIDPDGAIRCKHCHQICSLTPDRKPPAPLPPEVPECTPATHCQTKKRCVVGGECCSACGQPCPPWAADE